MTLLVGVQRTNGEWDNFVVAHKTTPYYTDSVDVLGRKLPRFGYIEVYDGVLKGDMLRLANELKGIPKAQRRSAFLGHVKVLRLSAMGGTMK
jgi:hypothetical protein